MKQKSIDMLIYIFFVIVIIILIGIIVFLVIKLCTNTKVVQCPIPPQTCTDVKVIRNHDPSLAVPNNSYTEIRDQRVISDPLYPPLNRTDKHTFEQVALQTSVRNINVPTADMGDSYRLVGYLTCKDPYKDAGGNNWKLLARQKNRHESDFYMIPTNKDYDVKVPLTPEVVVGTRLRDVYTIPNELTFNSPMLNKTPYDFIEIPKTSFADRYY